jgi:hypothetical protein
MFRRFNHKERGAAKPQPTKKEFLPQKTQSTQNRNECNRNISRKAAMAAKVLSKILFRPWRLRALARGVSETEIFRLPEKLHG